MARSNGGFISHFVTKIYCGYKLCLRSQFRTTHRQGPQINFSLCSEVLCIYSDPSIRCYATNRKVAGSIPASVSGFFIDIKSFRSHYGPEVDSASNRNEYQEYFLGVKAAGA